MALIGPYHGSRSLTGVLTCKDRHHAHQAVQLLRRALASRDTAAVAEDLHALAAALPDAPASSLRTATAHAASGTWPAPAGTTFRLPDENPGEDEETQEDEAPAAPESGTPHGARLKDLPGKVVRITHLPESHITDEDALIRAAMADGWEPLPASELDEDDPRDLIGAVMTLTESGGWITGADTLEDQSDPTWSRCSRSRNVPAKTRTARTAAGNLRDQPVTKQRPGDWELFTRLPSLTWSADPNWRRRMARAFDDLTDDLEHGRWPQPSCTAEEMALHLAIEDAPSYLGDIDTRDTAHSQLPEHPDDYDWNACSDLLFQDHDVLMLFDARLDGIEDPAGDVNQRLDADQRSRCPCANDWQSRGHESAEPDGSEAIWACWLSNQPGTAVVSGRRRPG